VSSHPTAIFFDMDGTILDWQTGMEESWLASCVLNCDGTFVPDDMHEAIRARRTWFWDDPVRQRTGRMDLDAASREIVRHAFEDAGLDAVDLAHRIADGYRARRLSLIAPYPRAIETLEFYQSRGVRMALLTNGEAKNQRNSVVQHDLERFFDCIIIEGEFGTGKPDERVFQHALAACNARPDSTWMVGDSLEADIAPALSLGMHAIWVDGAGAGLAAGATIRPHRIVAAISELIGAGAPDSSVLQ
jgi:putative hydrolase of the HAD superfamily